MDTNLQNNLLKKLYSFLKQLTFINIIYIYNEKLKFRTKYADEICIFFDLFISFSPFVSFFFVFLFKIKCTMKLTLISTQISIRRNFLIILFHPNDPVSAQLFLSTAGKMLPDCNCILELLPVQPFHAKIIIKVYTWLWQTYRTL